MCLKRAYTSSASPASSQPYVNAWYFSTPSSSSTGFALAIQCFMLGKSVIASIAPPFSSANLVGIALARPDLCSSRSFTVTLAFPFFAKLGQYLQTGSSIESMYFFSRKTWRSRTGRILLQLKELITDFGEIGRVSMDPSSPYAASITGTPFLYTAICTPVRRLRSNRDCRTGYRKPGTVAFRGGAAGTRGLIFRRSSASLEVVPPGLSSSTPRPAFSTRSSKALLRSAALAKGAMDFR
mmetsp:Transcript_6645/g.16296  ORF Transcript_6645/g.16296 Transcript_6645/m.16296 type:complete len:239 (+) Transcript_6645:1707-2423(+)